MEGAVLDVAEVVGSVEEIVDTVAGLADGTSLGWAVPAEEREPVATGRRSRSLLKDPQVARTQLGLRFVNCGLGRIASWSESGVERIVGAARVVVALAVAVGMKFAGVVGFEEESSGEAVCNTIPLMEVDRMLQAVACRMMDRELETFDSPRMQFAVQARSRCSSSRLHFDCLAHLAVYSDTCSYAAVLQTGMRYMH